MFLPLSHFHLNFLELNIMGSPSLVKIRPSRRDLLIATNSWWLEIGKIAAGRRQQNQYQLQDKQD
jgi:hypothetical protein